MMIIWRIAAITCAFTWTIIFFAFSSLTSVIEKTGNLMMNIDLLYIISIIISLYLIVFPTKFILYSLFACFWGLLSLFDGGSITGIIMYLLGCAFAYKAKVFISKKVVTLLYIILPLLVIFFQYRFGIEIMIKTLLDLFFLLIVAFLCIALFNESFFTKFFSKETSKLDLTILKPVELEVLREVLADKKYSAIADELNKSESAIKLIMRDVYAKLHVSGKQELMQLYGDELQQQVL